jgi:glycerophosphoryl diester phosphodiesterase
MHRAQPLERIAHRGAKKELPENTIPAFRRAFERGADAIELDVHATRDGVVVVHHDPALASTRAIADMSWSELRRVELAPGISVPRLDDVLAMTPAGRIVYVEIKGERIEAAVATVITESPARCAVHSFDHDAIARLRAIAPDIPRGILFDKRATAEATIRRIEAAGARDLWPRRDLIDPNLVALAHGAGARVIAWTVNSMVEGRALAAMGVDGLCTDDVRLLDDLR